MYLFEASASRRFSPKIRSLDDRSFGWVPGHAKMPRPASQGRDVGFQWMLARHMESIRDKSKLAVT